MSSDQVPCLLVAGQSATLCDFDSSLAVENGNSSNISRKIDDLSHDGVATEDELEEDSLQHEDDTPQSRPVQGQNPGRSDSNTPIICETINDLCAEHSKEELKLMVKQIVGLKIDECYFSQRTSTLCVVIEVDEDSVNGM